MKDVIRNPICPKCGGLALLGKKHMEHHHLILENARLRDELNQLGVLENNFMSWPLPSLANPMPPIMGYSGLDLALGRNSFGSLNSIDPELPTGLDFGNWVTSVDVPFNKSMFQDLALAAMDELIKLAQLDSPLWFRNLDGSQTLNLKEYASTISPCLGMKPDHFVTEATKATGTVIINSVSLAETLMNTVSSSICSVNVTSTLVYFSGLIWLILYYSLVMLPNISIFSTIFNSNIFIISIQFEVSSNNVLPMTSDFSFSFLWVCDMLSFIQNQWMEMFPYIIGRASTVDVISAGTGGNRNGALQLVRHIHRYRCNPSVPQRC